MTWFGRELRSLNNASNSITYTYDEGGLRTSKTVNGVKSDYYYVDGKLFYEKRGNEELYFYYDAYDVLSRIDRYTTDADSGAVATKIYYVHCNTRGDVEYIYYNSGTLLAKYTYDSWGKLLSVNNASGNAITNPAHIGNLNPIRYRGYYYDSETGLYYLQSRYYDPVVGRFLNADDTAYIGASGTVIGYNLFAYCENSPVKNSDPWGTWKGTEHYSWTKDLAKLFNIKAKILNKNLIEIIAKNARDLDVYYPPFPPKNPFVSNIHWIENQKYHFDRRKALGLNEDSRLVCAEEFLQTAIMYWATNKKTACLYLGWGIHCIQDTVAHGNYGANRKYLPSNHWLHADDPEYDWKNEKRNSLVKSDKYSRVEETKFETAIFLLRFWNGVRKR